MFELPDQVESLTGGICVGLQIQMVCGSLSVIVDREKEMARSSLVSFVDMPGEATPYIISQGKTFRVKLNDIIYLS